MDDRHKDRCFSSLSLPFFHLFIGMKLVIKQAFINTTNLWPSTTLSCTQMGRGGHSHVCLHTRGLQSTLLNEEACQSVIAQLRGLRIVINGCRDLVHRKKGEIPGKLSFPMKPQRSRVLPVPSRRIAQKFSLPLCPLVIKAMSMVGNSSTTPGHREGREVVGKPLRQFGVIQYVGAVTR